MEQSGEPQEGVHLTKVTRERPQKRGLTGGLTPEASTGAGEDGSITVVVDPRAGVLTEGRAASLEEAKAHFQKNWERWKAWAKIAGQPTLRSS